MWTRRPAPPSLNPSATAPRSDVTDVTDAQHARELVEFTVDHFGGFHVMCNNAGVLESPRRFLDKDLRAFQRVVAVDLFGVMLGSRYAALYMVGHGGGVIVNVASAAGIDPGTGMLPYRAAKAGGAHFTRCLAVGLGEPGVRVHCVAPVNIVTEINAAFDKAAVARLQPLACQGRPADVAEVVLSTSPGTGPLRSTGVVLPLDGGVSTGTPASRVRAPAGQESVM
ncbi:SDR family NAD(P)-dependent oxidoreductase [Streptomyces sp. NPDC101455]|uniref:SDR family NAD(P)-dependent oxidoreductase n=1 Tax=Streptomyces sp. NPDC101455 TaxID=3366142 RepID=UPI003807155D